MIAKRIRTTLAIGLTGGPGVGKSEVAKILTDYGAEAISADKIGHQLLENNLNLRRKLINLLGDEIINQQNKLDRRIIGDIVFGDEEKMTAFNGLIHPLLLKNLKIEIANVFKKGSHLVIVDAALIFEWGIANWFDLIMVVNAKRDIRLKRMRLAGLSANQARRRIAAQMPQREKIALADYLIDNNSGRFTLKKKVGQFISKINNLCKGAVETL